MQPDVPEITQRFADIIKRKDDQIRAQVAIINRLLSLVPMADLNDTQRPVHFMLDGINTMVAQEGHEILTDRITLKLERT